MSAIKNLGNPGREHMQSKIDSARGDGAASHTLPLV